MQNHDGASPPTEVPSPSPRRRISHSDGRNRGRATVPAYEPSLTHGEARHRDNIRGQGEDALRLPTVPHVPNPAPTTGRVHGRDGVDPNVADLTLETPDREVVAVLVEAHVGTDATSRPTVVSGFEFREHDGVVLADVPLCFLRSCPSGHVFRRMDASGLEVELTDACLDEASRARVYEHLPRRYAGSGRATPADVVRPAPHGRLGMAEFADGSASRGIGRFGKLTKSGRPEGRGTSEVHAATDLAGNGETVPSKGHLASVQGGAPALAQVVARAPALPRHKAVTARTTDRARDVGRVGTYPRARAPVGGLGSFPNIPFRSVSPALGSRKPQVANKGHGSTVVLTPGRRRMPAESLGEGNVILGVLALPMVTHLVEQPDPVPYADEDGKRHWFTFDLLAEVVGGRRFLIETKPAALAEWNGLEAFLRFIAPQIGRDRADAVCLVTERQVPRAVLHDARIISSSRKCPVPADDERLLAALPSGGARLADLGAATGLRGRAVRAAARLLGSGVLVKAAPGRIGPELFVTRAGEDPA